MCTQDATIKRLMASKMEHRIKKKMTDRTEQEKISDRKARGNKEGLLLCGSKARAPEEIQYKIETYQ